MDLPTNEVGIQTKEPTMTRTLYERVIGDRLGSAPRGGARRHRGARDIDLDVVRTRRHATSGPATVVRPFRPY